MREIRPTEGQQQPVPAPEKPRKKRRPGWTEPPEVAAETGIEEEVEAEAGFVCPFHSAEEIAAMSERQLDRICRLCCFVHLCGRGGPI